MDSINTKQLTTKPSLHKHALYPYPHTNALIGAHHTKITSRNTQVVPAY